MQHQYQHFHIIGMGQSGKAVAHYLHAQGLSFTVSDDHPDRLHAVIQETGWRPCQEPEGVLVVSPGVDRAHAMVVKAEQRGQPVMSDVALFFRLFQNITAVGVTGSTGKTTTCHMVHHALGKCGVPSIISGNSGVPIFATIHDNAPFDGIYILELSSYQLDYSPHVPLHAAVLLNLSPHHLERHHTMDQYRLAKENIFNDARHCFADDEWVSQWGHTRPSVQSYLSHDARVVDKVACQWIPFQDRPHNKKNRCAAQCIGRTLGYDFDAHLFDDFCAPAHRQEYVACINTVTYINDSKATSPSATASALACMPSPLFWIAGGVVQDDDLTPLIHVVRRVAHVFCIGQSAGRYSAFARDHGVNATEHQSLDQAVQAATQAAKMGSGTILFSPACASFDQFDSFVHRGNHFKACVHGLSHADVRDQCTV